MKSVNIIPTRLVRRPAVFVSHAFAAFAVMVMADTASAAEVTLNAGPGNAGDAINTSSFASALNWSDTQAPTAGNSYIVPAGRNLRTPLDAGTDITFAGDSMTVAGSLVYKSGANATNINTVTINNLTLNGGTVNNAANFLSPFILAGNGLAIQGAGTSTLLANNATLTVASAITGSTGTLFLSTNTGTAGRQVILSGVNTYTGNILVGGLSGALLSTTGKLAFAIGANGVNNTISGASPFQFDGAFTIDLTAAGDTVGNRWTLVDVATVQEIFSGSFTIDGFTRNFGFWTSADGKYQFNEVTGVLSRIAPDTDGDGLTDAWEETHFGVGNLIENPYDDYDNDFASNHMEFLAGSDPDDVLSYPDTDNDNLNDGWEMAYFNNLGQTAAADPDGDFNSNLIEYAAGTMPNSAFSYPDQDDGGIGDGMNDGWEIRYFGSITAADPAEDSDGDLFSNDIEFLQGTLPNSQVSSPDNDGDGLPDGWEVKYFRVGLEELAEVTTRQNAEGDADADAYTNLQEFRVGTDPTLSSSAPSALAYWRFEEKTSGAVPGDGVGGSQVSSVLDSSGLGNHLMTWRDYTAPTYSTAVPFATVPLTGSTNTASLAFVRDGGNLFITDNIYTTSGVGVNSHVFGAFTIEASFNTNATNVWQVVVGKTGNPIGGQAPFSLKIRASDNRLIAGMVDGAGTAKEAISTRAITTGTWFSSVVTASATELKLWIKGAADANYVLEATTPINGAFYTYAGVNSPWVVGLGKWNNADADPFGGNIDEIRISPKVLQPSEFLIPITSGDTDNDGMADTWENTWFKSLTQTATGDFDGDGTDNLTEFRLGLVPDSGSSRFAAAGGAGGNLTWPSVTGVTFIVQRSTSLAAGSWSTVGTVPGTAGTAGFTDPLPPAGTAFYRVLLQP
jgi:Concanavalin A-like lectin/glucanases superfamily/Bacterial TSP3 repeat